MSNRKFHNSTSPAEYSSRGVETYFVRSVFREEKMNAHLLFVATLLVGCLSIAAPPIPDVVTVLYTEYLNGVNMFRGTIFFNKKEDLYRSQGLFKDDKELWQHFSQKK